MVEVGGAAFSLGVQLDFFFALLKPSVVIENAIIKHNFARATAVPTLLMGGLAVGVSDHTAMRDNLQVALAAKFGAAVVHIAALQQYIARAYLTRIKLYAPFDVTVGITQPTNSGWCGSRNLL